MNRPDAKQQINCIQPDGNLLGVIRAILKLSIQKNIFFIILATVFFFGGGGEGGSLVNLNLKWNTPHVNKISMFFIDFFAHQLSDG